MKILHTSDLHIGKRVNEYSMLDEQRFILKKILGYAQEEQPDAIILAGDIYDKSIPSEESVSLFDDFLVDMATLGKAIFIISGNHDSAERISFASRIMKASKVYLSSAYDGKVDPIIINDGSMETAFYMLPFIKPSLVQHYAEDDVDIKTYNDAMKYVIDNMSIDKKRRNILITHQFITDAERSESEDIMVGGIDNIDASTFDKFDYVALGHLHRPQYCGRVTIRYSGSPLKYSFSEVNDKKSISIIELDGEAEPRITERYLSPMHDWHDLRGTFEELTDEKYYTGNDLQEAFVRVTLTDEDDIPDGVRKLRTVYHRLMELRYDNSRTRAGQTSIGAPVNINKLDPKELFEGLYQKQNARDLSDEQNKYLSDLIKQIFNNN